MRQLLDLPEPESGSDLPESHESETELPELLDRPLEPEFEPDDIMAQLALLLVGGGVL